MTKKIKIKSPEMVIDENAAKGFGPDQSPPLTPDEQELYDSGILDTVEELGDDGKFHTKRFDDKP